MLLSLLLAASAPAPALAPFGPWRVEAEDNLCLLTRGYGRPDRPVTVALQPMFTGERMDVIVVTADTSSGQWEGDAVIAVGGGRKFTGTFYSVRLRDGQHRFTRLTVDSELWDAITDGAELTIRARSLATTIRIVQPARARTAFDACQQDLLRGWGVDPANVGDKEHAPHGGNLARYFGADSYPAAALENGVSGRVVAVLQIDAAGAVAACRIVASAGPALNEGTCATVRRVRFRPATDAAGKPVASLYILPVRWMLPESG